MVDYLTTVTEVKRIADLTNEYTDAEIGSYITEVEYDIFGLYPNFKKYSEITIASEYDDTYYIHNKNSVYRPYSITLVREEDTDLDANWYEVVSTDWTANITSPTITVPSAVQSGSDTINYRIDWIPYTYNRLATLMTYKRLLAKGIIMSNTNPENPTSEAVDAEILMLKKQLMSRGNLTRSSVYATYDSTDYISYEQYDTE